MQGQRSQGCEVQGHMSRITAKSWTCAPARTTIWTKLLLEGNHVNSAAWMLAVWFAESRAAHELRLAASQTILERFLQYVILHGSAIATNQKLPALVEA